MTDVGDGSPVGMRWGQDSTQELRRQLWGLVGFGDALGGRLQVGIQGGLGFGNVGRRK